MRMKKNNIYSVNSQDGATITKSLKMAVFDHVESENPEIWPSFAITVVHGPVSFDEDRSRTFTLSFLQTDRRTDRQTNKHQDTSTELLHYTNDASVTRYYVPKLKCQHEDAVHVLTFQPSPWCMMYHLFCRITSKHRLNSIKNLHFDSTEPRR